MSVNLFYLPWGTPQAKLAELEASVPPALWRESDGLLVKKLRTGSGAIQDYEALRRGWPDLKVEETVQLGQVLPEGVRKIDRKYTSIRNLYSFLAAQMGLLPDSPVEEWGLHCVRLDDADLLDDYLGRVGYAIGKQFTTELHLIDAVMLDTFAWTMPETRLRLGLTLTGQALWEWESARESAFVNGWLAGGARVPYVINSVGYAYDDNGLERHSSGLSTENAGRRWYLNEDRGGIFDGLVWQSNKIQDALRNPTSGTTGYTLNVTPYEFQQRGDMTNYLRWHAVWFKALEITARMRRIPCYWHCNGDKNDNPFFVTDYPAALGVLKAEWVSAGFPHRRENFCWVEDAKGMRLTCQVFGEGQQTQIVVKRTNG